MTDMTFAADERHTKTLRVLPAFSDPFAVAGAVGKFAVQEKEKERNDCPHPGESLEKKEGKEAGICSSDLDPS